MAWVDIGARNHMEVWEVKIDFMGKKDRSRATRRVMGTKDFWFADKNIGVSLSLAQFNVAPTTMAATVRSKAGRLKNVLSELRFEEGREDGGLNSLNAISRKEYRVVRAVAIMMSVIISKLKLKKIAVSIIVSLE